MRLVSSIHESLGDMSHLNHDSRQLEKVAQSEVLKHNETNNPESSNPVNPILFVFIFCI